MKVAFRTTIGEVLDATGGTLLHGSPETVIQTITTDSRDLDEDNLFIPIIGERFDGHRFIGSLIEAGKIACFLTMREELRDLAVASNTAAILCDDTIRAYGRIAGCHRDRLDPVVVAVTGTNGKTTTKELIAEVMKQEHECLKNEKNLNNEIGIPYTLLHLTERHQMAILELGMNHPGEIERLSRIAKPDVALITNIGAGHLEFLGSVENVAAAKAEIMLGMEAGVVFLNRDTPSFELLRAKAVERGLSVKSFGLHENADIAPGSYQLLRDAVMIDFGGSRFRVPLYGIHNIYNGIAAIAVGLHFGIDAEKMQEAFQRFVNVGMRSQIVENDVTVINDTYNSNPLSSHYALVSAAQVFPAQRKIAVLSDMKELGELSAFYHDELGREVFQHGFDLLYSWGELSEEIARGARDAGMRDDTVFYFREKRELIDALKEQIVTGDVVLVKGSRSMKMEEVVEALVH